MKWPRGSRSGGLGAILCLVAGGATGCVSSSIAGDVGRVRELTRIDGLTHVADVDVDPVAAEDARRLLQQPLDAPGVRPVVRDRHVNAPAYGKPADRENRRNRGQREPILRRER